MNEPSSTTPLSTHSFSDDSRVFVAPGWRALHALAFDLAQQIRNKNEEFDRVVTLAKGGWPMSRSLADFLEVNEVQSLGISFYTGVDQRKPHPIVYQDLPIDIAGETILLFDDVADTGESLEFATNYLYERGAHQVTTAAIFYKERSKLTPDYFAAQVAEWIVFPYELVETLRLVGTDWLAAGIDPEEITERFVALQFDREQVLYFINTLLLSEV